MSIECMSSRGTQDGQGPEERIQRQQVLIYE
jgi:hypothetical protein